MAKNTVTVSLKVKVNGKKLRRKYRHEVTGIESGSTLAQSVHEGIAELTEETRAELGL